MKIHFLGIKGTGMSALALIFLDMGHEVSGSDYSQKIFTEDNLISRGIKISDFAIANLDDIDLLVVGHNFIDSQNIELVEAKKRKIKIIEYHECLSELIKNYYSIAISGSSGKSTTTALIASILNEIENTSYLIGSGEGKGNKDSKYFTFEACEHKEHFLIYHPDVILINNIDYDHVDYYKDENMYKEAFMKFGRNYKEKLIVNGDDETLKDTRGAIVFGIKNRSMFNARNINLDNGISYDLYYENTFVKNINLKLYGLHMVYNTLAAISTCMSIGIDIDHIYEGLKKFKGVKRRFAETIINDDVYIDDYAHHPSKIRATIEAVRSKYKDKKIIAFYRPDRDTRLEYFAPLFAKELLKADKAYVLPFIVAKERKEALDDFLNKYSKIKLVDDKIYKKLAKESNCVYLMMSSKDMGEVKDKLLEYKR